MGSYLSKPNTHKTTKTSLPDSLWFWVKTEMQGWRTTMEDGCIYRDRLSEVTINGNPVSVFGVFDGHGGAQAAEYCSEMFIKTLLKQLTVSSDGVDSVDNILSDEEIKVVLEKTFMALDEACASNERLSAIGFEKFPFQVYNGAGTTAVVCLVIGNKIYTANAGDSRAVICRFTDEKVVAVALSDDHKPMNETEVERITKAGSFVTGNRVAGSLAVSRAIGDHEFKKSTKVPLEKQAVTAFPDITVHEIQLATDEFLIVCCDGLFERQDNNGLVSMVRSKIQDEGKTGKALTTICEEVLDASMAPQRGEKGSDNMTMIVVRLPGEAGDKLFADVPLFSIDTDAKVGNEVKDDTETQDLSDTEPDTMPNQLTDDPDTNNISDDLPDVAIDIVCNVSLHIKMVGNGSTSMCAPMCPIKWEEAKEILHKAVSVSVQNRSLQSCPTFFDDLITALQSNSSIEHLTLSNIGLSCDQAKQLLQAVIGKPSLQKIDLSLNYLEEICPTTVSQFKEDNSHAELVL